MTLFYITYILIMAMLVGVHTLRMSRLTTLNEAVTQPGTIVVIFYFLYCIIPTLFFLTNTTEGAPFQWQSFSDEELRAHLLRSVVFLAFLILSLNVLFRREQPPAYTVKMHVGGFAIIACVSLLIFPLLVLSYLSAPVNHYYDFYTRFDHLTGVAAVVVSVCKRLAWGMTPITLFLLSVRYADSMKMYLLSVSAIVIFLVINSHGARIDAMLAIIQAVCYRALWARKQLSLGHVIALFPLAAIALYILRYVELARLGGGATIEISLVNALFMAPGEFFALLFPSIELYRLGDDQIVHDYAVYFKDILAIVPFLDVGELDLMYWYWKTFAPSAPVPPYTMGVLADPAILGAWWLVVEALVIGWLAVAINNLRMASDPFRLAAFGYLASLGVLVLKYNMLTYVDLLINNFIPAAFLMWIILNLQRKNS